MDALASSVGPPGGVSNQARNKVPKSLLSALNAQCDALIYTSVNYEYVAVMEAETWTRGVHASHAQQRTADGVNHSCSP